MSQKDVGLILRVDVQDANTEELDDLTRQLRDEIEELGVESVDLLKAGAPPKGTKGMEALSVGGIALTVLPTLMPRLVEFLQNWLLRGEGRKIKIKTQMGDRSVEVEYSPSAMSQAELKSLVDTLTGSLTTQSSS